MPRPLSLVESELQEFHSRTRRGVDIDAHALGVLPDSRDEDMAILVRYDKQALISKHQLHLQRLYAGIRQRAVEHACELACLKQYASDLGDRIRELRIENARLRQRKDWVWIAVTVVGFAALYLLFGSGCRG